MKFLLTCCTVILLQFAAAPLHAQTADQQLETFFKAHLEQCFQLRPLEATMLGDHRFDDQLDDISAAARQQWLQHYRSQLQRLEREIPRQQLSRSGQVDYEILRDELVRSIWLAENTRPFEEDPRTYGSYITDSVYSLLVQSTLPKETNIKNAIARIGQIPRIVQTARQTLRDSPPTILETAILQNRGAIGFYEKGIYELIGASPQLEALRARTAFPFDPLAGNRHLKQ